MLGGIDPRPLTVRQLHWMLDGVRAAHGGGGQADNATRLDRSDKIRAVASFFVGAEGPAYVIDSSTGRMQRTQ